MDSIFTRIQKFVTSNAGVLPTFHITAIIGGLFLFSAGLTGLYSPSKLADQFGIPLKIQPSSQKNKQDFGNINSNGDQELAKAGITACSGCEVFLGSLILSLLYLKEHKALGVAMTFGNLVGAVDTIAALKGGREGTWKKHAIPTALLVWMGPLGMFLSG
jgi:hypothetical protein